MNGYAPSLPLVAALAVGLSTSANSAESLNVGWPDLAGGNAAEQAHTLPLEGERIALAGYLLPADREGELVYSFMLVPRRGACSHMTQPPANQVIRVIPEEPYRLSMNYEPVSIAGTLEAGLELTQLFILDGVAVIESGYTVRKAEVRRVDPPANAASRPAIPWSFLNDRAQE